MYLNIENDIINDCVTQNVVFYQPMRILFILFALLCITGLYVKTHLENSSHILNNDELVLT